MYIAFNLDMENELIAVPVYQERISPLFDAAKKFVVYEIENKEIRQKITIHIQIESELLRIERLKEIGVTGIICGAISGYLSQIIAQKGIELISWASGIVDESIELYLKDMLKFSYQNRFEGKPAGRRRQCIRVSSEINHFRNNS